MPFLDRKGRVTYTQRQALWIKGFSGMREQTEHGLLRATPCDSPRLGVTIDAKNKKTHHYSWDFCRRE
jgi:hypothetical protein